jgi:hypothetical protein
MSAGRIGWHELMTTDVEGAKRFYGELLGVIADPAGAIVGLFTPEQQ